MIPSLLLSVLAVFPFRVPVSRWLPIATSSAAHLVDDGHVVGKVTDIVVLLAHRYLAMHL